MPTPITSIKMIRPRELTASSERWQIKVIRIKRRWHARLFDEGVLRDEMACECREDIGWICREMMRWQDKAGGDVRTSSARRRINQNSGKKGKVWYYGELERSKQKKART